jgi:hypothetical protein
MRMSLTHLPVFWNARRRPSAQGRVDDYTERNNRMDKDLEFQLKVVKSSELGLLLLPNECSQVSARPNGRVCVD